MFAKGCEEKYAFIGVGTAALCGDIVIVFKHKSYRSFFSGHKKIFHFRFENQQIFQHPSYWWEIK
jgi:hypothetical protein